MREKVCAKFDYLSLRHPVETTAVGKHLYQTPNLEKEGGAPPAPLFPIPRDLTRGGRWAGMAGIHTTWGHSLCS